MRPNGAAGALLVLVVGALLAGCGGSEQAGWLRFRSEEGGFSILMPGTPTEEVRAQETELGKIEMHMFTYKVEGVAYMVGYSVLPAAVAATAFANRTLDGACDGLVDAFGGTEMSRKDITVGIFPGRDLEIRVEDTDQITTVHSRIYMVKDMFYQLVVVGREGQSTAEDTVKYLDSFTLEE